MYQIAHLLYGLTFLRLFAVMYNLEVVLDRTTPNIFCCWRGQALFGGFSPPCPPVLIS